MPSESVVVWWVECSRQVGGEGRGGERRGEGRGEGGRRRRRRRRRRRGEGEKKEKEERSVCIQNGGYNGERKCVPTVCFTGAAAVLAVDEHG